MNEVWEGGLWIGEGAAGMRRLSGEATDWWLPMPTVSDAIAQTICCVAPPGLLREKAGKEAALADEFELRA